MLKEPPADAIKLQLVVLHDQRVLLPDGNAIAARALPDHLKKTLRVQPDTIILLSADTTVHEQVLSDLVRQLQDAGFPFAAPSGWIGQS
jgi:biopolymer transport protein ExbD